MQQTKKNSLFRTAHRLFIIGKLFGVSCFSIKKLKDKRKFTEITRFDMTVLFGFFALLVFLMYGNYVYPQNMSNSENDKIFNATSQIVIGLSPIVCASVILKAFLDREKLWTVVFDIMNIDKRVNIFCIIISS